HPGWYSETMQADGQPDIAWLKPGGAALGDADWDAGRRCIGILMRAQADGQPGGETCLLLVNAEPQPVGFTLPPGAWQVLMNSAPPEPAEHLHVVGVGVEAA